MLNRIVEALVALTSAFFAFALCVVVIKVALS